MITETERQLRIINHNLELHDLQLKNINRNLEQLCRILSLKDKEDPDENSISEPKGL